MNDPWHEETLDALVAYLEAATRGARAVVVTSSQDLVREVKQNLEQRLGSARRLQEINLSGVEDPAVDLAPVLRGAPNPGRVTFVLGISAEPGGQRGEDTDEASPALRYLNLNRELFDRPNEAFVFFFDSQTATALAADAPDFNRYTNWFELYAWEDLIDLRIDSFVN